MTYRRALSEEGKTHDEFRLGKVVGTVIDLRNYGVLTIFEPIARCSGDRLDLWGFECLAGAARGMRYPALLRAVEAAGCDQPTLDATLLQVHLDTLSRLAENFGPDEPLPYHFTMNLGAKAFGPPSPRPDDALLAVLRRFAQAPHLRDACVFEVSEELDPAQAASLGAFLHTEFANDWPVLIHDDAWRDGNDVIRLLAEALVPSDHIRGRKVDYRTFQNLMDDPTNGRSVVLRAMGPSSDGTRGWIGFEGVRRSDLSFVQEKRPADTYLQGDGINLSEPLGINRRIEKHVVPLLNGRGYAFAPEPPIALYVEVPRRARYRDALARFRNAGVNWKTAADDVVALLNATPDSVLLPDERRLFFEALAEQHINYPVDSLRVLLELNSPHDRSDACRAALECLFTAAEFSAALEISRLALRLDAIEPADRIEFLFWAGRCCYQLLNYDAAYEFLDDAISRIGDAPGGWPEPLRQRALGCLARCRIEKTKILYHNGDFRAATSEIRDALAVVRDNRRLLDDVTADYLEGHAHFRLGKLFLELGQMADARRELEIARRMCVVHRKDSQCLRIAAFAQLYLGKTHAGSIDMQLPDMYEALYTFLRASYRRGELIARRELALVLARAARSANSHAERDLAIAFKQKSIRLIEECLAEAEEVQYAREQLFARITAAEIWLELSSAQHLPQGDSVGATAAEYLEEAETFFPNTKRSELLARIDMNTLRLRLAVATGSAEAQEIAGRARGSIERLQLPAGVRWNDTSRGAVIAQLMESSTSREGQTESGGRS